MATITEDNFYIRATNFLKANPDAYVMIRPDRPVDMHKHRYASDESRRRGNTAMKAWFEYLAANKWLRILNTWRHLIRSGKSIMVPCEDPCVFDLAYVPRDPPVLPSNFWDKWESKGIPVQGEVVGESERRKAIVENSLRQFRARHVELLAERQKQDKKIGDSRTPAAPMSWEERERFYRENPVVLSKEAITASGLEPGSERAPGEVL